MQKMSCQPFSLAFSTNALFKLAFQFDSNMQHVLIMLGMIHFIQDGKLLLLASSYL